MDFSMQFGVLGRIQKTDNFFKVRPWMQILKVEP